MMEISCDLHTHTLASDGTTTPAENVQLAKEAGLNAVAITDHDTIAGIAEAIQKGMELGVEVVPGVEISTAHEGKDIHILGYFIPFEDPAFHEALAQLRDVRHLRNLKLIARLQEIGVDITVEDVYRRKTSDDKNIGRPHIAEELVIKGLATSIDDAFRKYLGEGGAAYVNVERIEPLEAINMIKKAGGVAVIAHPGLYQNNELVEELIVYGLDGIEINHPDNSEEDKAVYRQFAEEYGLIVTGGSDFHGYRGNQTFHAPLGAYGTSSDAVDKMRRLAALRQQK
ncbi:PHP domain protein [Brevibacillus laterosporus GI-9]|uniref:PHP domain-containing protein n=1 Tax=Brevibacillus laterosporus TaxID=1465 RepID=UPI0002404827|nr:PHP domain-containing protein [Brevibacillus laterosporus]CCF13100.1 PHP domain protein [Brevibacillus laterosporus GI-9]